VGAAGIEGVPPTGLGDGLSGGGKAEGDALLVRWGVVEIPGSKVGEGMSVSSGVVEAGMVACAPGVAVVDVGLSSACARAC
jgi:hypothetical protein